LSLSVTIFLQEKKELAAKTTINIERFIWIRI